jgi:hypothetical protein
MKSDDSAIIISDIEIERRSLHRSIWLVNYDKTVAHMLKEHDLGLRLSTYISFSDALFHFSNGDGDGDTGYGTC